MRSVVRIDLLVLRRNVTISKVHVLTSQVVNGCHKVTTGQTGQDLADRELSTDLTAMLLEELAQTLSEAWAEPIHAPIDRVFDCRVPGFIDWKGLHIIDNVKNRVSILEASEIASLAVAYSEDKVAGSLGGLHSVNGIINGLVELKHIS